MRFLVDENLPALAAGAFTELGHDTLFVPHTELRTQTDDVLVAFCNSEARYLVTRDEAIPYENLPISTGYVIVQHPNLSMAAVAELIRENSSLYSEEQLEGKITVIEPGRVRSRKLS